MNTHLWSVWDSYFQDTEQNWTVVVSFSLTQNVPDKDVDVGEEFKDSRQNIHQEMMFKEVKIFFYWQTKCNNTKFFFLM